MLELSAEVLNKIDVLHDASEKLCNLLLEKNMTISCAESATCGLVAKLLTDKAGSSSWFWGGVASYANEAKHKILGVSYEILDNPKLGPVSDKCAISMAEGMRKISNTDIAISVTGLAGPTGDETNRVGTVYLGFASSFRESLAIAIHVNETKREQNREIFALSSLEIARLYIQGCSILDIDLTW